MIRTTAGIAFIALVLAFAAAGCTTTQSQTTTGAVIGTATGAVVGYQTGDNKEERQRNAVIGGVLGGATGGYVGHEMSMSRFCPTCGREYGDDQNFCSVDGAALKNKQ